MCCTFRFINKLLENALSVNPPALIVLLHFLDILLVIFLDAGFFIQLKNALD